MHTDKGLIVTTFNVIQELNVNIFILVYLKALGLYQREERQGLNDELKWNGFLRYFLIFYFGGNNFT